MSASLSDQFARIEEKLCVAWKFLSGESRRFHFYEGMSFQDAENVRRRMVLPVILHDAGHLAAIALLIDQDDAEKLAAWMFGILRQDLIEENIVDACAEACNVLSGAIIEYLSAHDQVEVGIPMQIDPDEYQSVSNASEVKAYSNGELNGHQILLVIFDPLAETKHMESN